MDSRTTILLRVLDSTGVAILIALLRRPLTEKALVEQMSGTTQSVVHKKLKALKEAGIIRRPVDKGKRKQPWSVVAPLPTSDMLRAIVFLADALDAIDRQARRDLMDKLDVASNSDLRLVDGR